VLRPTEEKTVQLQIKGHSDLQSEAVLTTASASDGDAAFPINNMNIEGTKETPLRLARRHVRFW
jgi:hypothetical protein